IRRDAARGALTDANGPPPLARRVWSSMAHDAQAAPRVSILTALYNHADQIVDALESLRQSSFDDFESIVVDDGSSDGSLREVLRWGERHPEVPLVVVTHPVNRGLPHARTTALDFALGE